MTHALADQVMILAAGNTTWTDVLLNTLARWKIWAAVLSLIVLGTAGIFLLGRVRFAGLGLIILSVFVAGFFLTIDRWVGVTTNTYNDLDRPASTSNPFGRG